MQLYQKETPTRFEKHLPTAASENNKKDFLEKPLVTMIIMINMGSQRQKIGGNWLLTSPICSAVDRSQPRFKSHTGGIIRKTKKNNENLDFFC